MVMGAGALGGYFGARLAAAGHEVTFIARGPHLEAMQARGLRVESPLGDLHLPGVAAHADPAEAVRAGGGARPEAVLFMVKNRDVEAAAERLLPALGPDTVVATVQNGVTAPERLGAVIGPERVIGGVVVMPADVKAPGVIRHSAPFQRLILGTPGGPPSPACQRLVGAASGAGFDAVAEPDIGAALWGKLVGLSALSGLTALTRLDIGPIRETPETRALLRAALEEAEAVARAACPTLPETQLETSWRMLTETLPPTMHASMLDDLMRGRPIELPYLSGEIVRRGEALGVPTPVQAMIVAALAPCVDGPPGAPRP